MSKLIFAVMAMYLSISSAWADDNLQINAGLIMDVITGASSTVADGVWFRVQGQVASANCYYPGFNASIFYAKSNGAVDPKKALAILMMAKIANRGISIQFNNSSGSTDFWNYGITSCEITRLAIQ